MIYLLLCLWFGIAGAVVARIKGSSMFLWFLISAIVPVFGLIALMLYRSDRDELRRQCPGLREDREDPRRAVHPLRHRARVPGRASSQPEAAAPPRIDSPA